MRIGFPCRSLTILDSVPISKRKGPATAGLHNCQFSICQLSISLPLPSIDELGIVMLCLSSGLLVISNLHAEPGIDGPEAIIRGL